MVEATCHLRGQYLIVFDINKLDGHFLDGFEKQMVWNNYTILSDTTLQITQAATDTASIILIGYILHHEYHDLSNEKLLLLLLDKGQNAEDIIMLLQDYGGRYVALIKDNNTTVAITDACATRQLYWFGCGDQLSISSSAKLILDSLGQKPEMNLDTVRLLDDKVFKATENAWYGDKWYDARINKVLANHYLNMKTNTAHRLKYRYDGPTSYPDILDYVESVLTGLIKAAHSRYQIIQPLTAGYDSRLLLAASKTLSSNTLYYVFENNKDLNQSSDVKIAKGLCMKVGLDLEIVLPGRLKEDFVAKYEKKCFFPRILPKTAHIQWHYYHHGKSNILNINGNCVGVVKCVYQNKARGCDDLGNLIKIAGCKRSFAAPIEAWYPEAISYSRDNNISVYDLFYWEQRMSNWGAIFPFEQDIAIEELSPFNHKNLLFALLHVEYKKRKSPQRTWYEDLILRLWPETLSLPFNPIVGLQVKFRVRSGLKRIWELAN